MDAEPRVFVRKSAESEYEVRPAGSSPAATVSAISLTELSSLFSAEGADPQEEFDIKFIGTQAIEAFFEKRTLARTSLGWECVMFPSSPARRRKLATPPGFEFSEGIEGLSAEWLISYHPLAKTLLSRPDLARDESILIRLDSRPVGWVPVQRVSERTSVIKLTFLESDVFAEEPRNLSHLRLSAWSSAMHRQHEKGRTVVSFIPDDGDDINAYKRQVAGADVMNHWWSIRTRRTSFLASYPSRSINAE